MTSAPGRPLTLSVAATTLALIATLFASACGVRPLEIASEPLLSPVGSGLQHPVVPPLDHPGGPLAASQAHIATSPDSLWRDTGSDLFRDARARRIGDVLTVSISMKDRASLANSSKRSRNATNGFGLDVSHDVDWRGFASAVSAKAASSVSADTATDGKGAVARSESIDLSIAAVVTDVLANGNLLIQGTQELRVNYEIRVLTFTGIVNVADIKGNNTIPFDRIAEARMSYGGRGRIMEVQQPGWGQQIVDLLTPF
jgi:flagellar L-ring protein FlgH